MESMFSSQFSGPFSRPVISIFGICSMERGSGRRGGLMVSALGSGASGPGSSPGRGHCVVLLGKTLYSHSVSTQV